MARSRASSGSSASTFTAKPGLSFESSSTSSAPFEAASLCAAPLAERALISSLRSMNPPLQPYGIGYQFAQFFGEAFLRVRIRRVGDAVLDLVGVLLEVVELVHALLVQPVD